RYARDWGDQFRIEAGVGVWRDTTEEVAAKEDTEDTGLGASLAARHTPTGINFAVNYAVESFTDDCAEPGVVSGDCRGNDEFLYVKGGVVRDLVEWGPTAFYGEHYWGWKEQNESDPDALRTLELNPDEALELNNSTVTGWGAGVVQHIKSYNTEVYVGYRNYELDLDLIDDAGSVAAREFEDLHSIVAGATIHWGGGKD
ncbi:MAG: hypothetical protein M3N38_06510, partial [Pseudomonadota bacterium]|nr:hypothetical protein [Pseudomonadota bacterium]